jgi:CBS domain-containing protein
MEDRRMKAQELMTTPVSTCTPDTNLASAAMTMWSTDCGVLPVVSDNRVIGMISDRDICMAAATQHRDISQIPVGSVISGQVKSCRLEDDLTDVLKTMEEAKVRRLPVVDEQQELRGLISINDLILHAEEEQRGRRPAVPEQKVMQTLKGISSHWLPVVAGNGKGTRSFRVGAGRQNSSKKGKRTA